MAKTFLESGYVVVAKGYPENENYLCSSCIGFGKSRNARIFPTTKLAQEWIGNSAEYAIEYISIKCECFHAIN